MFRVSQRLMAGLLTHYFTLLQRCFRGRGAEVRQKIRQQLAAFLKKARGEMTFAQFEKKMGISTSTLHRIEIGEQNVTIDKLEDIKTRLKASMSDIFPE